MIRPFMVPRIYPARNKPKRPPMIRGSQPSRDAARFSAAPGKGVFTTVTVGREVDGVEMVAMPAVVVGVVRVVV